MGYFNSEITSPDSLLEIAHRRATSARSIQIFGFNRDVGLTYETIFNNGGGLYQYPGSAVQMTLVSSDVTDTMPVIIEGLDSNYNEISEIVALNGTTPVVSGLSFFRINNLTIASGNNVGNITVSNGGTTYGFIEAGFGTHQAIVYTVPAGYSLYVMQAHFTSGTIHNNGYFTSRAALRSSTGRVLHFWESTFATNISFDLQSYFRVPQKTDFSLEAKSSSTTNELGIYIGAVLLEEEL